MTHRWSLELVWWKTALWTSAVSEEVAVLMCFEMYPPNAFLPQSLEGVFFFRLAPLLHVF